jgi:tricorn protease
VTESAAYLRDPHVHGALVAFIAENDVWLAPTGGGRAWRVSADHVPVACPRFSPDGTLVAWASVIGDTREILVAPVEGGSARRLTFWGGAATVLGWTAAGEVLALSSVGRRSRVNSWAWAVPLDGGPARELPYGRVGGVAAEPGGERALLLSSAGYDPAHWKRYRGGTAGKLWIGTAGDFARVHADLDGNIDSPMWLSGDQAEAGGRIAFLSDHQGVGQLWSSLADGSDLRCHSAREFYARSASTDGVRVVYHSGGDLWLVDDLAGAQPCRLDVRLGGPRTGRQPYPLTVSGHLGAISLDADARSSVVEVRGTIHRVAHREGSARVLSDVPGVRNRLPQSLPGGASVWVTDADGDDALQFSDGRRIAVGQFSRVEELAVSPDGSRIALANRDGMVLLVHDGMVRELDRGQYAHATGLAFSPDSRWLVWSQAAHPAEGGPRQLKLADLTPDAANEVTALTCGRFNDYAPAFTRDGKNGTVRLAGLGSSVCP